MYIVIITSPHSLCIPGAKVRTCDLLALKAAEDLVKTLKPSFYVLYFPANVYREKLDLNRDVSVNSPYRRRVTAALADHPLALIDVHSDPRGSYGADADIVILDNTPETTYGKELYNVMLRSEVFVIYREGSKVNSITQQGREYGVPSILIEYTEDLNQRKIHQANEAILTWLRSNIIPY
jgi:hypothetical protein